MKLEKVTISYIHECGGQPIRLVSLQNNSRLPHKNIEMVNT